MEKDDRYTRITLRIPKRLHERLAESAEMTSKSMNAEIVARLEASYMLIPQTPTATWEEFHDQEWSLRQQQLTLKDVYHSKLSALIKIDAEIKSAESDTTIEILSVTKRSIEAEMESLLKQITTLDDKLGSITHQWTMIDPPAANE